MFTEVGEAFIGVFDGGYGPTTSSDDTELADPVRSKSSPPPPRGASLGGSGGVELATPPPAALLWPPALPLPEPVGIGTGADEDADDDDGGGGGGGGGEDVDENRLCANGCRNDSWILRRLMPCTMKSYAALDKLLPEPELRRFGGCGGMASLLPGGAVSVVGPLAIDDVECICCSCGRTNGAAAGVAVVAEVAPGPVADAAVAVLVAGLSPPPTTLFGVGGNIAVAVVIRPGAASLMYRSLTVNWRLPSGPNPTGPPTVTIAADVDDG